jgi:cation diffusion facilitator CzcD-associated flavoprotein CzcO
VRLDVGVIGAGFSGTMAAIQLSRLARADGRDLHLSLRASRAGLPPMPLDTDPAHLL